MKTKAEIEARRDEVSKRYETCSIHRDAEIRAELDALDWVLDDSEEEESVGKE